MLLKLRRKNSERKSSDETAVILVVEGEEEGPLVLSLGTPSTATMLGGPIAKIFSGAYFCDRKKKCRPQLLSHLCLFSAEKFFPGGKKKEKAEASRRAPGRPRWRQRPGFRCGLRREEK